MPINFAVKLAATVAIEALQMGLQASKRTTGPRLDELTVTVADFGTPIPRFLGERRFACPVFHAEDLKEVEHNTKVKGGGKQTTYSYLATFACAIADNAIDKVLKIFFDDKLVYDATGTGPISYAASLGIDLNSVMRIYYGTETQDPDPRYSSWCEDRYGANSAPAYRGVSYLFFEELPVDNFGNRIPQISVIATSAAADAHPYELLNSDFSIIGSSFSPDGTRLYLPGGGGSGLGFEVWDVPTLTRLVLSPTAVDVAHVAVNADGSFYGKSGSNIWLFTEGGAASKYCGAITGGVWNTRQGLAGSSTSISNVIHQPGADVDSVTTISTTFYPTWFFDDADDDTVSWAIGGKSFGGSLTSGIGLYNMKGGAELTAATGDSGEAYGFDCGNGKIFARQNGNIYLINKSDGSIAAGPVLSPGSFSAGPFKGVLPGDSTIWIGFTQFSTTDLSTIRSVTPTDWATGQTSDHPIYDRINDAMWTKGTLDPAFAVRFLDRAGNDGTTLGAIVTKMCDAAGVVDYDVSLLTQPVKGYSWTRGDVKSQMDPVLDIHDVDACPHDFGIKFLPRGSSSTGTIQTVDFAKNNESARYTGTWAQDTDLTKLLRVNFADTDFDQQTNNVLSLLPTDSVDSERDDVIDLTTYAATPDEAQQLADRYIRRTWNSRESIEASLTAQYLAIEPGDVKTLDLDGIEHNVRLTKQTIAGGRMDCTFVRDETGIATTNSTTTGPAMDGRDTEVISVPAPVSGFVIDAPYRYDSDDDTRPLLYDAAGAYASLTFPGASIWEQTGSGTSAAYDQLFATVSTGATWGTCQGALGNVASPWLWDRGNTLTVTLQSGSLTSVTEADINAAPT